jgi:predicted nucleic-acid-binding protein
MKIVADTNLLLRFVLSDDPVQFRKALEAMEKAEAVIVTNLVLCELVWVLRSRYGVTRQNLLAVIALLRKTKKIVVDNSAIDAGLSVLAAGADFADGMIAFEGARLGGDEFVSFDKKAVAAIAKRGMKIRLLA